MGQDEGERSDVLIICCSRNTGQTPRSHSDFTFHSHTPPVIKPLKPASLSCSADSCLCFPALPVTRVAGRVPVCLLVLCVWGFLVWSNPPVFLLVFSACLGVSGLVKPNYLLVFCACFGVSGLVKPTYLLVFCACLFGGL